MSAMVDIEALATNLSSLLSRAWQVRILPGAPANLAGLTRCSEAATPICRFHGAKFGCFSGTTRGHGSNPCVACADERCHCGHSGSGRLTGRSGRRLRSVAEE